MICEAIALSYAARSIMADHEEILPLFNKATGITPCNEGIVYTFDEEDWYDPDTYAEIDKRLSFLCSLDLDEYAYIRVEPDEEIYYGGNPERFNITVNEEKL